MLFIRDRFYGFYIQNVVVCCMLHRQDNPKFVSSLHHSSLHFYHFFNILSRSSPSCVFFWVCLRRAYNYQNTTVEASNSRIVCICRTHSVVLMSMSSFSIGCLLFVNIASYFYFFFHKIEMWCESRFPMLYCLFLMSLLPMLMPLMLLLRRVGLNKHKHDSNQI